MEGNLCSRSIGLAYSWKKFTVFALFTLYLRAISKCEPLWGLIFRGAI